MGLTRLRGGAAKDQDGSRACHDAGSNDGGQKSSDQSIWIREDRRHERSDDRENQQAEHHSTPHPTIRVPSPESNASRRRRLLCFVQKVPTRPAPGIDRHCRELMIRRVAIAPRPSRSPVHRARPLRRMEPNGRAALRLRSESPRAAVSWLVQPRLVNGPFDDPGLYLDFRYGRRAILFDLGDLSTLSAREISRVSHAFVSHSHMDHVAGFDRLLRICLHRPEPLVLVGPAGFIDQVEHRIRSFTWNLLNERSVDFRLQVMEFDGERLRAAACFRAREGFVRQDEPPPSEPPGIVLSEEGMRVEAVALDHGIPSLAFALRETLRVNVWRGALERLGLPTGPWLAQAKNAMRRGAPDGDNIEIPGHGTVSLASLRQTVFRIGRGQVVAYITDAALHAENRRRAVALAEGADQAFIEAVFLHRDRALAEATHHLTAQTAGEIAREAGARHLTVFHHSARYLPDTKSLRQEALRAYEGAAPV